MLSTLSSLAKAIKPSNWTLLLSTLRVPPATEHSGYLHKMSWLCHSSKYLDTPAISTRRHERGFQLTGLTRYLSRKHAGASTFGGQSAPMPTALQLAHDSSPLPAPVRTASDPWQCQTALSLQQTFTIDPQTRYSPPVFIQKVQPSLPSRSNTPGWQNLHAY